jgi:hypothetical protein
LNNIKVMLFPLLQEDVAAIAVFCGATVAVDGEVGVNVTGHSETPE